MFQIFLTKWFNQTIKDMYQSNPVKAEKLLQIYDDTTKLFLNVSNIYLDKKQAIINTFLSISEALND